MAKLPEKEVYAKTVFAEARGESVEGQKWVAWVIKNRARINKSYWGGNTIKGVCLEKGQFECWNGVTDITIAKNEKDDYDKIKARTDAIYKASASEDPTGGADHYHNPAKELYENYSKWTKNCDFLKEIDNHHFYKSKKL